jgi:5-methylcytosine-specific restriction protein A
MLFDEQSEMYKRNVSESVKKLVAHRQKWHCARCQQMLPATFECDHIVALYNGGSNDESNLQCLCANCHREKTVEERLQTDKKERLQKQTFEFFLYFKRDDGCVLPLGFVIHVLMKKLGVYAREAEDIIESLNLKRTETLQRSCSNKDAIFDVFDYTPLDEDTMVIGIDIRREAVESARVAQQHLAWAEDRRDRKTQPSVSRRSSAPPRTASPFDQVVESFRFRKT